MEKKEKIIMTTISDVLTYRCQWLINLENGLEVYFNQEDSPLITPQPGQIAALVMCKNLPMKMWIDGKEVFSKSKEQLLDELRQTAMELTLEAEEEHRIKIHFETNKKVEKLLSVLQLRFLILQENRQSSMQPKDWKAEIKACEIAQIIFKLLQEKHLETNFCYLTEKQISSFYPDLAKEKQAVRLQVLRLVQEMVADEIRGIDLTNKENILEQRGLCKTLRVPTINSEEAKIVHIVNYH